MDLPPPPDAGWLLSQLDDVASAPVGRKGRASNRDINLQEDFNNSQFLHDATQNIDNLALEPLEDMDLDLDLDFGDDLEQDRGTRLDTTVEVGRDAPSVMAGGDDIFSDLGVVTGQKDARGREESMGLDFGDDGIRIADDDGDIPMGMGDDDYHLNPEDQSAMPGGLATLDMQRARISESPLSDIDEDATARLGEEVSRWQNADLYEPEEEPAEATVVRHTQRAKKRKLLLPDDETMLTSAHIRDQQTNRDNILKSQSFLPRDPIVLALMEMHKSGGFVSSIILDGRSAAWAPELRGMLSLDSAPRGGDLKRKRDSGVADMESDNGGKSPRLELEEEEAEEDTVVPAAGADRSVAADGTILEIPADEDMGFQIDDEDQTAGEREGPSVAPFDETAAPIVHPEDSGPVSLGTKHAVHILRDLFGPEAEHDDEKRSKSSVVFQDLLPEKRTTKADATKMFFECLVLATKDAIKVEQGEGLGAPIRVRGKRGLWGAWAEREAGGEIAEEEDEEADQEQNAPEHAAVGARAVAVGA
jgi:cohesin complex subunit SCC1